MVFQESGISLLMAVVSGLQQEKESNSSNVSPPVGLTGALLALVIQPTMLPGSHIKTAALGKRSVHGCLPHSFQQMESSHFLYGQEPALSSLTGWGGQRQRRKGKALLGYQETVPKEEVGEPQL